MAPAQIPALRATPLAPFGDSFTWFRCASFLNCSAPYKKIVFRIRARGGKMIGELSMSDEPTLLAEFAANRSERAFAGIVALHLNLVFSTALRQLGDRGLAEEVTQNVFLELARKSHRLDWGKTLAGWLYRTTLNQARQTLRSELRRRKRELTAAEISATLAEGNSAWGPLLPLLDEALLDLREEDRLAVILHHMERLPFREVARALGVGEDAARKRVNKVMAGLANWFRKRGVPVNTSSLAAALSLEGAQAAPVALASTIAKSAATVLGAAAPAASILTFFAIMTTQGKLSIAAALLAAAVILSPLLLRQQRANGELSPPAATNPVPVHGVRPNRQGTAAAPPLAGYQAPPPESVYQRINNADMSLTMLPRYQAEAFLAQNKTNAESLLAAFRVTHDLEYLRHAANKFPNDPAVLMRVVLHDAFPGEREAWLARFQQADPSNALPHYLAASEHLKKNDLAGALEAVGRAGSNPAIRDYVTEHIQTLEEIYLSAGFKTPEAKAIAMAAVEMPHIARIVEVANSMRDQMKAQLGRGEGEAVQGTLRGGLQIANHLSGIQDGGNLLGEMVSVVVEKRFLEQAPPAPEVQQRLAELTERENAIRADSQFFERWIAQAPETEIVSYFDRLKLYGETAAMDWLKNRNEPR